VIADTEAALAATKLHEATLKASLRIFRMKMEAGQPLPVGLTRIGEPTQNYRTTNGSNEGDLIYNQ
jgi:hypothetical protein